MTDHPDDNHRRREAALWIMAALLATFVSQRLYLHLVDPNSDFFIVGFNIHHLFTGALIEIPAAIVLAVGVRITWARRLALASFGIGSAMVLDEVVYLVTTDGSNAAYLTPISLWGAITLVSLAAFGLLATFVLSGRQ